MEVTEYCCPDYWNENPLFFHRNERLLGLNTLTIPNYLAISQHEPALPEPKFHHLNTEVTLTGFVADRITNTNFKTFFFNLETQTK